MNQTEARHVVAAAPSRVAPDVDLGWSIPTRSSGSRPTSTPWTSSTSSRPSRPATGHEIPERDYRRTDTLDTFTDYLVETVRS